MRIFIGYDSRQPLAYTVCRSSIERYAKGRVQIEPLRLDWLPITRRGLTEFTYARYLVPWLCDYEGYAMFMDGDMMARGDISELRMFIDPYVALSVVKGARAFEWPSLMIFTNAKCRMLTPEFIDDQNSSPNTLEWAGDIGELPANLNHCVGYDAPNPNAKIIHFTAGIPHFPETKDCEYAQEWREELAYATSSVGWEELMGKSVHRDIVKPAKPLQRFNIKTKCAIGDDGLYAHIAHALTLDLPVLQQYEPHDGVAVMVGSGPSIEGQVQAIRAERENGRPIIAIKGAHDWLIDHGIVPDFACCVDPGETQWQYFSKKHAAVKYVIASQCHPSMFRHLSDCAIQLFHCFVRKNQPQPPLGTTMIAGGTTTGLRAITLFYSMGYRHFELYGYDSCVSKDTVRVGLNLATEDETKRNEIVVAGEAFLCTPALTAQANEFQNLYASMPDIVIHGHGHGLIQTIIKARAVQPIRTVSFLHHGGPTWASYRYRCAMPATELGASINDLTADVLIVSKPEALTIMEVKHALGRGQSVIADFCDDHFHQPQYRELLRLADAVTCSTDVLKAKIATFAIEATVIPEPYEYPEVAPHCHGTNLLWFGHRVNRHSLDQVHGLDETICHLRIVSNDTDGIQWSHETMMKEFSIADIVLMPSTVAYKSANRTIEAIRQGCFVVAEPHPSLTNIPGIWIGDIKEGIEWAASHQSEANDRIRASQMFISQTFAPRTVAYAWSRIIQACPSTLGQVAAPGPIGSMSISKEEQSGPTYASYHMQKAVQTG